MKCPNHIIRPSLAMLLLSLVLSFQAAFAMEVYEEGVNFEPITPVQPTHVAAGKIELVEAFWYGCPHCYHLEPILKKWLKNLPENVEFVHMPAQFRPDWSVHAGAYYVSSILGIDDKLHQPLFDEIQNNRKGMVTHKDMAAFFARHGVAEDKYFDTLNSFAVKNKLNYSMRMVQRYALRGVPAMVVNGKYRVTASMNGNSFEKMLQVVSYLIARESAQAG